MRIRYLTILAGIALLLMSGVSFGQGLGFYFVQPPENGFSTVTGNTFRIVWANPDPTWTHFNLAYIEMANPGAQKVAITTTPVAVMALSYDWDVSAVQDGQYNIVAQVTNADGSMIGGRENTSSGYVEIQKGAQEDFTFVNPGRSNETPRPNGMFTIEWQTSLLGQDLDLYYSLVGSGPPEANGTKINMLTISVGTTTTYDWDTTGVQPAGCYYIGANVIDNFSDPQGPVVQFFWSQGCVDIDNSGGPGTFTFVKPVRSDTADDFYDIQWTTDIAGTLDLYFTTINFTYNPTDKVNQNPIAIPLLGATQSYHWVTQGLPERTYWIVAEITPTGQSMMTKTSPGTVTIVDKEFWFTNPPPAGATFESFWGASYTIRWDYDFSGSADPSFDPSTLTVNLYYDTDVDNTSGKVSIRNDLQLSAKQFVWSPGNVTGKIYIYGEVWKPDVADPSGGTKVLLLWNYSGPLTITQGEQKDLMILAPSSMEEIADTSYDVQYVAFKEGELVLYKNKVNSGTPSTQISQPIQITAGDLAQVKTYPWSTLGEVDGSVWYIAGRLQYTGTSNFFTSYSQGTVKIQHTPPKDITAPGTIELYALPKSDNPNAIELRWPAPADDGYIADSGPARQYDIRYSLNEKIQDQDWNSYSKPANIPTPKAPGEDEKLVVGGFGEHVTVYFAIKAADEGPNWSGMSNIAFAKTVPVELTEFYAVSGDNLITLYWTTATERDNLGFNILRKTDDSREYIKINSRLIQGAGTSSRVHSYSYEDRDVSVGILYSYILESVSTYGVNDHSEPIQAGLRVDEYVKPVILWGGYFNTDVTALNGGNFVLKACVESRYPIETVELLYRGIPTRIFLNDEGINGDEVAGDKIFTFSVDMESGLERGQYIIELKAIDIMGNESLVFPYLTVR
ncbi:hypothetical protein KKB18_02455 [bacterium]|nr:hypothetical protein [bacterium]